MSKVSPIWGYMASAGLGGTALAAVVLMPFLTPPRPGRTAGILFGPGMAAPAALDAVVHADPAARFVDSRWGGRLVFVDYADPAFPDTIRRLGALHLFDALAAGCHTGSTSARKG